MTSIEYVANQFGELNATNVGAETVIAQKILSQLHGYRVSDKNYNIDIDYMVIAIQAYAKLIQDAGVKII